uniref:Uncharacterized protein n=1 Tax=Arundo donax TaxID=35708 RepID=A0A0A9A1L2_ARUDO
MVCVGNLLPSLLASVTEMPPVLIMRKSSCLIREVRKCL